MHTYIVVDDEAIIRQGLQLKIDQTPTLQVTCVGEASNGLEALSLMKKVNPDFVITDMKMNNMDGMTLLEKMNQEYPEIPVIVISGYKLFDYVKQAIEKHAVGYVLKPFSAQEIAEQVKKAIELLESRKHVSQLQQEVEHLELEKCHEILFQVITQPWNEELATFLLAKGYSLAEKCMLLTITTDDPEIQSSLCLVCGNVWECDCDIVGNQIGKHQVYVLLHTVENENGCLTKFAEKLIPEIKKLAGEHHLFLCESRVASSFQELHSLYFENNILLRNVFLTDRIKFLNINEKTDIVPVFSDEEIRNLLRNMKYYPAKINNSMDLFFSKIDVRLHPFGAIFDACENLLERVNECASQNQVKGKNLMEQFYSKYIFCTDIEKIKSDFSEYIRNVFSSIHLKEKDQESLLNQMVDYIKKNYWKKLTLQQLAARFYISPSFCSTLLKENLNMTFNDYLSEIRLQNAKRLLDETTLSVNKVSDEVGYSNPKYFFKIFKKSTGYTPLTYRSKSITKTRE